MNQERGISLVRSAKENPLGFSLIESLLIITFAGIIVILLANLPNAMNLVNKSNHLSLAREIASKQIEDKRSLSYINLVPDTINLISSNEPRMGLLPSGSGTITVSNCDPVINSQYCPNNENIKIVTVTVNWKDNNKNQTISLNTFIGEGGINQ